MADGTKITIGEALEAAALSAGDQPVEPSDAAAIEAAEARAAGRLQDDDDDDDDADAAAAPAGLAARRVPPRTPTPGRSATRTRPRSATSSRYGSHFCLNLGRAPAPRAS